MAKRIAKRRKRKGALIGIEDAGSQRLAKRTKRK